MEDLEKRLTREELEYLKEIKNDYKEMEIVDLYEYLTGYFQMQGLEDIDNDPKQLILEDIIFKIAEE